MHLRLACSLLSLLIISPSLLGIEVFLKNGDRLQGELVLESDDHVTIRHPILGEFEVAKKDLAEWPPPKDPEPIVQKPKPDNLQTPTRPAPPEEVKPEEGSEDSGITPIVTKIPILLWNTPREVVETLQRMNSKIGFTFSDRDSRRDQTSFRFFYNSRWKNGKSEYRFDTDYRYSETDEETSVDRYSGIFRFRRQQQRNLFIQASTSYRRDPLREINHWAEQGFGGGWKKKVSKGFELSLGGEASVKYEDFDEESNDIGGFELLTSAFQDSVLDIGKNYQLIQEAVFYIAPDDSENWGYSFDLKLDGKISDGFSVQLGYEYSFDNIVPARVPQKETLLSSSILYTF